MSLFQFGFSVSSTRQQTPHAPENIALAASHLPDKEDTILGRNEYNQVAAAVVHSRGVKEANIFSIAEKTVPKLPNILVSMETRKPFNIFRRNILIWKKAHCAILRKLTKINWR